MSELSPCPMCGSQPPRPQMWWGGRTRYWTILCEKAHDHFVEASGPTRNAVIARWNARPEAPDPAMTAPGRRG